MQEDGPKARVRKRYKVTTDSDHDYLLRPICSSKRSPLSDRTSNGANDTTQLVLGDSGKLYLAVILDLFSRFVVGWASVPAMIAT
jgi:putative transposase